MAWIVPTEDDLSARLSRDELEAYRADAEWTVNPPEKLIRQAVEEVRGYVRSNRSAVMDPREGALPAMLVGPTMDVVVFNLVKRIGIPASEDRRAAWQAAKTLFEKVSEGRITPEPGAETPSASANTAGEITIPNQVL